MPRFSAGETIGFDAEPYGKAILRVTGLTDIPGSNGPTDAYDVHVLASSHPDFEEGTDDTIPVTNQNLCVPPSGADAVDDLDVDAATDD